ncbi:TonB-dependent receptor [Mucilaginibacter sp. JRF]|nr:TonB-dependent receptor [Mucilaginibacter sp. JRF]
MSGTLIVGIVLLCQQAFAQNYRVNGRVTDHAGQALPAAVVQLKSTGQSTITDSAGYFSLTAPEAGSYQLLVSSIGFKTEKKSVKISSEPLTITIVLHPQNHELEEVMVQDRYAAQRKQTESLNVEVVNADFIQRNLGGSLMATMSRLPGVKTIGIGSGQSKPLIRGLGFNRVVVVDKGVKHEGQQWGADHGLELDQFAANEVELVKGAASFIYGSDAIAGVIDVKPVPPPTPNSLGGTVDMIGKTNNNLFGTSVNLYGRKQKWFFDSRFTYQNYGDYTVPTDRVYVYDYAVKLRDNQLRNTAGRETGLHFNTGYVGEKFRSIFYVSNVYTRSGFFANAHGLEPRWVDTLLHDRSSRDIQLPSQEVNHFKLINRSQYQAGKHLLQAEVGYQHNFRQEFSQYVNHGYMPAVYPDSMRVSADLEREFDKRVYSLNLRDQVQFGDHELTFGINGEHQDNNIGGWGFLVPKFDQTTAGAFVYDKFRLNDEVLLHGALRYDHSQLSTSSYTDWFETEGEKLTRANALTRSFNSLVWSAGVNYTPEGHFSLKANIGKSFRMPIAKELAANGVNYHYFSYERGNPALDAEQSYQADITLGWDTEKFSVQLSPFYNYFPNYIYLNPTAEHDYYYGAGNQVFVYAQSRVARYGGELQMRYLFTQELSSEILAEYLYSRQLSGDKKGYTLPFSPPPSVLLNLTYEPHHIDRLKHTYFSVDYSITGAQNNIVPPELKTPGYQVWNIQAGTKLRFNKRPLTVSLQVQNVFNTRYLNHTSFYRLIQLPEAGRNIILSVKIPFGTGSNI